MIGRAAHRPRLQRIHPLRRLTPEATDELEQLSPVVWRSGGNDPGFVFDVDPAGGGFIGFFLMAVDKETAPRITFDDGSGFGEISALTMKGFPFAFYHVSLARKRGLKRLRFRPCKGPGTIRFVALQTANSILIAILHFLFNLRYQKIGIVAPNTKGRTGRLEAWTSTIARIVKFFRDVSTGGGVRVQEGAEDVLPVLKLAMTRHAAPIRAALNESVDANDPPLITFVAPTYNTRPKFLRDLLDSFAAEQAPYAELVVSDDGSTDAAMLEDLRRAEARPGVRVVFNKTNRGIASATNAGIAVARGRWVAFIDHDDLFVPGAVAIIVDAILKTPDAHFFYTDEIIVDGDLRPIGSFIKPAYDSVLLSGANYINHFSIFRADRLAALGGLRLDREGSQDYDLLLRYLVEAPIGSVIHIPFLAYMWRREETSYSTLNLGSSVENARRALTVAYGSRVDRIEPALHPDFHRVRLARHGSPVKISIVVPNRDSPALIKRILGDLTERTGYRPHEIIIVDNGTTDKTTLAFYDSPAAGPHRRRHRHRPRAVQLRAHVQSRRGPGNGRCRPVSQQRYRGDRCGVARGDGRVPGLSRYGDRRCQADLPQRADSTLRRHRRPRRNGRSLVLRIRRQGVRPDGTVPGATNADRGDRRLHACLESLFRTALAASTKSASRSRTTTSICASARATRVSAPCGRRSHTLFITNR